MTGLTPFWRLKSSSQSPKLCFRRRISAVQYQARQPATRRFSIFFASSLPRYQVNLIATSIDTAPNSAIPAWLVGTEECADLFTAYSISSAPVPASITCWLSGSAKPSSQMEVVPVIDQAGHHRGDRPARRWCGPAWCGWCRMSVVGCGLVDNSPLPLSGAASIVNPANATVLKPRYWWTFLPDSNGGLNSATGVQRGIACPFGPSPSFAASR